jgi:putative FmdB family regulatory protein
MPQYEYRCQADQSMIEMYQSFEESSIPNCPQCGQQMNKQFNTPPAIVFRGDGWAGKK